MDKAVAKIIEIWCHLVEDEVNQREAVLAASAMRTYIEGLACIKDTRTNRILLPACFDIYASCVESILNECLNFVDTEKTIKITTLLSKPLKQWYNISTELRNDRACALTRQTWEEYKLGIARLKDMQTNRNIQMRRIITGDALKSDNQMLYITDHQAALTVDQARAVKIPDDVKLLPEVKNSLQFGNGDWLIHLVGLANTSDETKIKALRTEGWVVASEHFRNSYHNQQHTASDSISPIGKGIFYIHQEKVTIGKRYEDLFLVDMKASNDGAFGIVFEKDYPRELSGILFLDDVEIDAYVKMFDDHWNSVE